LRAAATLATLAVFACIATAASAAGSATGKLCGASGCVVLPQALALPLSETNDTFTSAGTPRPAAYYKIVIHGTGDGHIPNRTILWVPSKNVWFDAKDHTPYGSTEYWRTAGTAKDFPELAAFAAKVKLYPAPKRWVLPHY
jgi:glyoxylase-like metal-dependent hydrolase (beta-lactamase superfamily II)